MVYSKEPAAGMPPRASILNTNGRDRWLSLIQIGWEKDERPRPWTEAEMIEIIRTHTGVPDLEVTLLNQFDLAHEPAGRQELPQRPRPFWSAMPRTDSRRPAASA